MLNEAAKAEVEAWLRLHNMSDPALVHDNLAVEMCICTPGLALIVKRPMNAFDDGILCPTCGGMTQRTGTCHTCIECGSTTGCG